MKQLKISILMLLVFTVITGGIYPLLITGIGMVLFPEKINSSLILKNGTVIGSELIGQKFEKPEFFQGRPSAVNYDSASSGGSNYGPTNKKFIDEAKSRAVQIRKNYNLAENYPIPPDLIFTSGSGLDPHISIEAAKLQADKIASSRKIDKSIIEKIINANIVKQYYFGGLSHVNVLKLNMDLVDRGILK